MSRLLLFVTVIAAMLAVDLRPDAAGSFLSAAWADDDDNDDDDDDDDDAPRRRIAPPRVQAPAPVRVQPRPMRAPNEVIARGLSQPDLDALTAQGFRVIRRVELSGGEAMHRLRKPARMTMDRARAVVRAAASAPAADFNHFYRAENVPGPQKPCTGAECPARQMIAWPADTAGCGMPPRIGMVDTGLNADHAVLRDAQVDVHRIGMGKGIAASDKLHGTSVAALLVGAADSRTPGLVPQARLIAVDAFYKAGGDERADAFALIEALDYLAEQGVDIINLSLAGPPNQALARQVRRLEQRGIVLVAAAGNGGPGAKPAYPAAYDAVIAVTAVDRRQQVYRRASRGDHIDLSAPGVDIWTAASISGARTKTGTSYAAPFVTAAAALLMQQEPDLTPAQVRQRLAASARDLGRPGPDAVFGHGLIRPADPCGPPSKTQGPASEPLQTVATP